MESVKDLAEIAGESESRPIFLFISFPPNLVPELLSLYSPGRPR